MITTKNLAFLFSFLLSATAERQNRHLRALAETQCDEEFCSNGLNCDNLRRCAGCEFTCSGQCNYDAFLTCHQWCKEDACAEIQCSGCQFCANPSASKCPLATFTDVTETMFSRDPSYWYQSKHSGMPYRHSSSPLFVDLNGDGYVDYFDAMHGHRMNDDKTLDGYMELALTAPSPNDESKIVLESIAERILFEDDPQNFNQEFGYSWVDLHGQNILDLDGDGILDLYIAQGGHRGEPLGNPLMLDSYLFFGELDSNGQVIFRGGRTQASASGVSHQSGRGRFNYMLGK